MTAEKMKKRRTHPVFVGFLKTKKKMKKQRTYITLFLWAAALLSGCTGNEEIVGGQSSLLTVAVTAADFSSDEGYGDPYHRYQIIPPPLPPATG